MSPLYGLLFSLSILVIRSSACSCREEHVTLSERCCRRHVVARIKITEALPDVTPPPSPHHPPPHSLPPHSPPPHSLPPSEEEPSGPLPPPPFGLPPGDRVENGNAPGGGLVDPSASRTYHTRRGLQGYRFEFIKIYRNVTNRQLDPSIYSSASSSACGYGFREGEEYLLFADINGGGQLRTGLCFGNAGWSALSNETLATLENKNSDIDTCVRPSSNSTILQFVSRSSTRMTTTTTTTTTTTHPPPPTHPTRRRLFG